MWKCKVTMHSTLEGSVVGCRNQAGQGRAGRVRDLITNNVFFLSIICTFAFKRAGLTRMNCSDFDI